MPDDATTQTPPAVETTVTQWCKRIKAARDYFANDFKQMREDMRFVRGLQWVEQKKINDGDGRYVANVTLRAVSHKIASLYARNPKAAAKRRPRLDFQLWDEQPASLVMAMNMLMVDPMNMEANALLSDYEQGKRRRDLVDRIGRTLEIVYQQQIDQQEPEFKTQMKKLVGRTVITGVGYARLNVLREMETDLDVSSEHPTAQDRMREAQGLLNQLIEDGADENDPRLEEARNLATSSAQPYDDQYGLRERLVFTFPLSTRIIPDTRCRSLRGFVGCDWIAQEYCYPLSYVRGYFGIPDLAPDGELNNLKDAKAGDTQDQKDRKVYIWEVFNKRDKTTFFVCEGYKDYLQPPQSVYPCVHGFWPIEALTFNEIESEGDDVCEAEKCSPFPPSDVSLMRAPQKERNRSRNALRSHRKANRPKYAVREGALTDDDLALIESCPDNTVLRLRGLGAGDKVNDVLQPIAHTPLDPLLYDTSQVENDILMTVGLQQENLGPVTTDATATAATIAEQSRTVSTSSNVDDLDDFLSVLARKVGDLLLLEFSPETVAEIAGIGAVWPPSNDPGFLNEIYLEVSAASSGRPNKAVEIANFERIAPLLIQSGANPQFLVKEGLKRLDDRIEPYEAFPLQQPATAAAKRPQQPPTETMNGAAIALPNMQQMQLSM